MRDSAVIALFVTFMICAGCGQQNYTWLGLPGDLESYPGSGQIPYDNRTVAFSPDGKVFAVATSVGVQLYKTDTQDKYLLLSGHTGCRTVVFSPDGKMLISAGGGDGTVRLWSVSEREEIAKLQYSYCIDNLILNTTGNNN